MDDVAKQSGTLDLEADGHKDNIDDVIVPATAPVSEPTARSYDVERDQESARRYIGYALLALLALVTLIALFHVIGINLSPKGTYAVSQAAAVSAADAKADAERLVQLLNILFGPIVTLVGSVTGFYFGAKTASNAANKP